MTTFKTIDDYESEIVAWGKTKGWDMAKCLSTDPDVKRDFVLHKLMLVVTEIAEAAEAVRDDEYAQTGGVWEKVEGDPKNSHKITKPEGMVSELADAVIRIMHLTGAMGFSLEAAIRDKMAYNAQREYMHGRKA